MCGIVAIFAYRPPARDVDRGELIRIRDHMVKRGPDGAGEWYSPDNRVALGHRRLAIIDLSDTGSQPMRNQDGSLVIVFNGEIYNHLELRRALELKGYRFKSTSDTEVLLHLYADKGRDMVHELRGMYAFSIWDDKKKGLFLARDPFGIKPLYYSDDGRTFRAASQVKALMAGGSISTDPDPAGHVGFFLWGNIPEPYTLYRAIRSLSAGSNLWVDGRGSAQPKSFCTISNELAKAAIEKRADDRQGHAEVLREALLDSVKHHLIADVPVGVFLSSGLDSTTLTALAAECRGKLHTVTLGFNEYKGTPYDETALAELVSRQYGTNHQTIWVGKRDFQNEYANLIQAMDQPSIDGVNSYFVSMAAARAGMKVAISGLGGDELFGSYPSFRQIPRTVNLFKMGNAVPALGRAARMAFEPFMNGLTSPKYAGLLEYGGTYGGAYLLRRGLYMPWELNALFDEQFVKEGLDNLQTTKRLEKTVADIPSEYHKICALELSWYMKNQLLCDSDWASMSHSVEVRAPFVDLKLLRTLGGMFGKAGAPTKRDMASTPRLKLPTEVLFRKKTGFTVPVRDWLMDKTDLFRERGLRGWAKTVYAEYAKSLGSSAVKLARYVPRSRDKKTVLIFRIGQLGDTLIAMPAIHAIRNKYPDHRLVLLTDQYYNRSGYVSSWNVLGPTGWFDDVLFYSPKTRYGVGNLKNLVKNIKELAPDHIYNVSPDRQPLQAKRDRVFFKYIIGVRNYHAFGASNAPQKMHPLPRIEAEWKRLMGIVNDRIENGPFRLPIQASERGIAENALHEAGISEDARIVAIGPGSKMPAKIWPAERYREVGRMILEKFPDVKLVVLGGREDWEIGERLCAEWGRRSFNFAGKLSIYGSAAVLERCVCYLGNDTGTMHLAAMVRIPCVAIFCARDYPGKWEPYGEKHRIIRKDVECAGCMLEVCSYNNRCLQLISVDDIFKELQGLI